MTIDELKEFVKSTITMSYSLPYLPKEEEIMRIIQFELRTIYRDYPDALQDQAIVIPVASFHSSEFKQTRTVQMPDCVMGIERVVEVNGGHNMLGINDPDMKFNRMMSTDLFLSPYSADQLGYRMVNWSMWDQAKTFMVQDIRHDFNINTKRLVIKGRTPQRPVMIWSRIQIEAESLFEDPIVQRWIVAECKKSLGRTLKMFNFTMVGGVTINADMWIEEGKSEKEEVLQEVKDLNQPYFCYMVN